MRAKYTVRDVLQAHENELSNIALTSWHFRTLHALRKCRTAELGGHIDRCTCCKKLHLSYNSCRNRHCPNCQGHKREEWITARQHELLNVPYFHVVFTLPNEFNKWALSQGKIIYSNLFKAAWQTIVQFSENPKHLGAKMGMIAILHTWGQNMALHPHIHCIVPGGGIAKNGNWKLAKNKGKYLFNVKTMSKVFRAKYVALLRKSDLKIPQNVYDAVFSKKWVIYAKQPFNKPKFVIEYLGRYTHKIAISNHRITHIDYQNKTVSFKVKNYRKGGQKSVLKLSFTEFIRRFSLHILPKGFTRIRHFGILSSSWKKVKLPALQKVVADQGFSPVYRPKKTDILHRKCPTCKKGLLETVLLFTDRGPPKNWLEKLNS